MALGGNAISVLRNHPFHLSYFNELAGGADRGWEHLIEANMDWGQDLLSLKRWLDQHPEARPVRLAYYGGVDPHRAGIDYELPPSQMSRGSRDRSPAGTRSASISSAARRSEALTGGGKSSLSLGPLTATSAASRR